MSRKSRLQQKIQVAKNSAPDLSNVIQPIAPQVEPEASEKKKVSPSAPASTVQPLLLTLADVCALLNISRATFYRLEKDSPLPGRVNLGGKVMYHRQIIEEWLLHLAKGE